MRLDEFDPNAINVEDQRGGRRGLPGGRGGQVGCGTLVIALIAALVFGVDPAQMIGGLEQAQGPAQQLPAPGGDGVGGHDVALVAHRVLGEEAAVLGDASVQDVGHVLVRHDGVDAGHRACGGGVDEQDPRMRVVGVAEGRVQLAGEGQVGRVAAGTGDLLLAVGPDVRTGGDVDRHARHLVRGWGPGLAGRTYPGRAAYRSSTPGRIGPTP